MKNLTTLVAIAAFAGGMLTAVQADANPVPNTQTVRFADLDSADARDTVVLYNRIAEAAHNVCRDLDVGGSLQALSRYSRCWHLAAQGAVSRINRQTLTAYALTRGLGSADAGMRIARSN